MTVGTLALEVLRRIPPALTLTLTVLLALTWTGTVLALAGLTLRGMRRVPRWRALGVAGRRTVPLMVTALVMWPVVMRTAALVRRPPALVVRVARRRPGSALTAGPSRRSSVEGRSLSPWSRPAALLLVVLGVALRRAVAPPGTVGRATAVLVAGRRRTPVVLSRASTLTLARALAVTPWSVRITGGRTTSWWAGRALPPLLAPRPSRRAALTWGSWTGGSSSSSVELARRSRRRTSVAVGATAALRRSGRASPLHVRRQRRRRTSWTSRALIKLAWRRTLWRSWPHS